MNSLLSFFQEVLLPFILIALSVALMFAVPVEVYGRYVCSNFQTLTGKETRWMTFDSCYIKTPAGWQRWDEYKMRIITNEEEERGE